jgi:dTDP-4-dehydrorhamnose reductase
LSRTLVIGAQGQLGSVLVQIPNAVATTHPKDSIEDEATVLALFDRWQPDLVFNCAAYNAVDAAESEEHEARLSNVQGPLNLARACQARGAKLVHFSTNYVFDGELDKPYLESDEPRPLNAYARSKLDGERAVLGANSEALVIRTAALYGNVGTGFPDRILRQAQGGHALRVVGDQRVNPTYAADLAAAAVELAAARSGIVHVVGGGCASWADFARAVLEESGIDAAVVDITTGEYPTAARRPLNGCLASEEVEPLRPWREALHEWAARRKNP